MLGRGGRRGICRVVFIDVIWMRGRNAFEEIWLFAYCRKREVSEVDGSRHLEKGLGERNMRKHIYASLVIRQSNDYSSESFSTPPSASNPPPPPPLRRCFLFATVLFFALRGVWRIRFRSRSGRCDLFLVPLSRGALVFGGTSAESHQ